jgi:Protein of unknown function (DUF2490)
MNYRNILIAFLLLFSTLHVSAQTQFSGWLADFNLFKINTKLSIHSDFQWRSSDQLEHTQTLLLRTGLNYHVNKKLILTGGYAYVHNRRVISNVSGYTAEHRIWEQLLFTHPLVIGSGAHARKGTLAHRLRVEQRFIPKSSVANNELKNDGNVYANRLRYFIRNVTPLVPWSAAGKAPFLALQNEVFANFGDKSAVNGEFFDQNRAYIALGYRFHAKFDAELGYMNQYINGRNDAFTNNHIVQLAGYVRL